MTAAGVWTTALISTAILRAVLAIPSAESITRREVRRSLARDRREFDRARDTIRREVGLPSAPDLDPRTGRVRPPDVALPPGVYHPEQEWAAAEIRKRQAERALEDVDQPPSIG